MIPREYRLPFMAALVYIILAFAGWYFGNLNATKTYNANLTELQQEYQEALATNRTMLREEYRDLEERQACLREELEWAGEYIKLLDSERIERTLRICY